MYKIRYVYIITFVCGKFWAVTPVARINSGIRAIVFLPDYLCYMYVFDR